MVSYIFTLQPISDEPGRAVSVEDFPDNEVYRVPNVSIEGEDAEDVEISQSRKRVKTDGADCGTSVKLPAYIYTARVGCNEKVMEKVEGVKKDASELLE